MRMMTGAQHTDLLTVRDRLRIVLTQAASQRDQRPSVIDLPDGDVEREWVLFERAEMLKAVNRIRRGRGHPPVELAAITRADLSGKGHSDWFERFTFDCARLAVGS